MDFDESLDEVFGVSNDKQQARNLSALATRTRQELSKERDREEEAYARRDYGNWRQVECLRVALKIKKRLREMQNEVYKQRKGARGAGGRPGGNDPTIATPAELKRQGNALKKGRRRLPSDDVLPSSDPEGTANTYGNSMSGSERAKLVRPKEIIKHELGLDYVRDPAAIGSTMFSVRQGPGHVVVVFHDRHPLSSALANLLVQTSTKDSRAEDGAMEPGVQEALRVIRGLIASFARVLLEADERSNEEAAEMQRCLASWSEKSAGVLAGEDD